MKHACITLAAVALVGLVRPAAAGDFHSGPSLICSDCHVAHYSQTHGYTLFGITVPLGAAGPYENLLRNDVNDLCLTCHDSQSFAPDVFGLNGGMAIVRQAGALNVAPGHGRLNDAGYDVSDGHTLWSTATAPGGTFSNTAGLECVDCHEQHGQDAGQFRNLWTSTQPGNKFENKNLTYAVGVNDAAKDVYERTARGYAIANVDFNEPSTTASAYGAWCASCHVNFHGAGGVPNMGGTSGGAGQQNPVNATPWVRHPTADVNIGNNASATYVSSLTQFNSHTNRVKVMDSQGLWNGLAGDNTVTPSCMSCHKGHGNKNPFGLIYMAGTGTVNEEGDGGLYKDLCRQCHVQGG